MSGAPTALARRLRRLPAPVAASALMLTAALGFAAMNAIIRLLTHTLPPFEVSFFRNVFGLMVMLPVFVRLGPAVLKTGRHGLFAVRGVIHTSANWLWFFALAYLPVDQATALNFTVPVFATIGAALVLGERVARARWMAIAVGIGGSLVILRPGFQAFAPTMLLPIAAALGMGANMLVSKVLARTESPATMVIYMNLYMTALTLGPALVVWQSPSAGELLLGLMMGALGSASHFLWAQAFRLVDASVVAPFDLARLPFGAILGFALFGELMDGLSWLGAAIIFAANLYMIRTESRPPGG
ncbi:MAG: DMT family transporter [Proteobacteria bacterium]|nr:DMT family transporter [Pseudomonadota bacterium]